MAYRSLYKFIERKKKFQVYKGTLDSVLDNIIEILSKTEKSRKDYTILAFQVPRIVRALVDYKNDHPKDINLLKLMRECFDLALRIYHDYESPNLIRKISLFKKRISQKYKEVLKYKLQQHHDQINLIVSKPELSQKAAERLPDLIGKKRTLLIVIGHGAIGVGMDVFLRYQDLSKINNIQFYVIRFSRTKYKKYGDKVPQITALEIKYLQKLAKEREVIVYDENTYTGETLREVVRYLSKKVFSNKKIGILYNMDTSKQKKFPEPR